MAARQRGTGSTSIWNLARDFPQRARITVGHAEYFGDHNLMGTEGAGTSVEAYEPVGLASELQSLTGRVWLDFDAVDSDDADDNWEVDADAVYIGTAWDPLTARLTGKWQSC